MIPGVDRFLCNRFLTHSSHTHATEQKVEWYVQRAYDLTPERHLSSFNLNSFRAYAFDIHVNSFLPLFFHLYIVQFFLSPVLTRHNWVCIFAGNTLYLAALSQYVYVTCELSSLLPYLLVTD